MRHGDISSRNNGVRTSPAISPEVSSIDGMPTQQEPIDDNCLNNDVIQLHFSV